MDYQQIIFAKALNIEEPYYVKDIVFSKEDGELHIYIDFREGSKFKCRVCGKDGMPVYDTEQKEWRHLDFFQYKAYIHFRTPRTDCPEDKVHMIDVPWGGAGSGFTLLMEAMILELSRHMPVSEIAKNIGEHDTRVWRVIKKHINNARAIEDYSAVTTVGVDETSSKKGHNYITLFVDMDKAKVIFVTEGKGSDTVGAFKEDLKEHNGVSGNVINFSSDMSPAFIKGIETNFGWANITFDKFHVMKLVNQAVDEARREEQKNNPLLKNSRFIWLKNRKNLTAKQDELLGNLSKQNLKTGKAYRIKLAIQDIYNSEIDKIEAMKRLQQWLSWAFRCRIDSVKKVAKTIKTNWNGIINYFDTRITNGLLEGINSLVQAAKARARGFRNTENFIAIVYLLAGKLTFRFDPA